MINPLNYKRVELSAEDIAVLRRQVLQGPETRSFDEDPHFGAQISALGIFQEVGTLNDQLADYLYDSKTKERVNRKSIRAEMIEYHGHTGVRIWSEACAHLDLRLRGARELLHPKLSFSRDGSLSELVFFPESIAKIAKLAGAELVIVREWALNTVFGGFDRTKRYYEANPWELIQNDSLRYTKLIETRKIAFLGTHDFVAHIAGLNSESLTRLQVLARSVHSRLNAYFSNIQQPPIYSLVLPYAAGLLLDDLAQPGNYEASARQEVLEIVLNAIDLKLTDPRQSRFLTKFPNAYEKLILLARESTAVNIKPRAASLCAELVQELKLLSTPLSA
ncbi:MAG: hypothetical protein H7301_04690 [Cryobacterium sp.]|nr:hypothetical protein [Oligoflexia bacterium]